MIFFFVVVKLCLQMQKREDNGCKAISSGSAQAEGLSMDGVYEHLVLCFIRPKTFTQGAVQTPAASYSYLEQLQQAKTPGPDYLLQGDRTGPLDQPRAQCLGSWKTLHLLTLTVERKQKKAFSRRNVK